MERLHLPDNIKVHFAGLEGMRFANSVSEMGVQYGLFTAYPYVYDKMYNNKVRESDFENLRFLTRNFSHIIQDSGLFTFLFGSSSKNVKKETIYDWYDGLVEWTLEHGQPFTCVEVDAQSIIGVDETWRLREKMREDLPNNRIINVFHLEDGAYGLDKLIEYSDYIGIAAQELSKTGKTEYVVPLARYIRSKKSSVDIHLLGCTIPDIMKSCIFCTSCDSVSWKTPLRFGEIDGYHISHLSSEKCCYFVGDNIYKSIGRYGNEQSTNAYIASIEYYKRIYEKCAGNQDYSLRFLK